MPISKLELRRLMRDRLSLPPDLRAEKSARICAAIIALPQWQSSHTIALFAPQTREPDIDLLWNHAAGKIFAYPRVEENQLTFHAVDSLFDLQPARWDLREPPPLRPVTPESIDLILVPGVAFTLEGSRCGRGGGFYDRFLKLIPLTSHRLGICFSFQLVEELPVEPHDLPMDAVITD
jgi:5-formyltetrahydrofolate cyclo-ligase